MLPVLEVLCCAAADRGGVDWYSLCCCGRFRRTPDWRAPWRCSWCSRSSVAPPPAVGAWTGTACAAADASDEPQTGGRPGDAPGARGPLEGALEMLPVLEVLCCAVVPLPFPHPIGDAWIRDRRRPTPASVCDRSVVAQALEAST
jgi:hypothetical protein|uniref:Uncharacterized protein n=1 Tax=Zea mays TaxID=4577 RepID=A0A804RLS3_MAIZE